jgi:nicotinate-nucleotide pyrophosphorylase (carboxylating)
LAVVRGSARAILTGERTALNFVQRLCGIATLTRRYVEALGDCGTKILDTRKTTPGWRFLEKYAVRAGGGQNHRFGLYDRVMIKDNHRELAKLSGPDSIARAVSACRAAYPGLEVEVEADTLAEVQAAAAATVDYILLDNMSTEMMAEAVRLVGGRARLEASGGITLERLPGLAGLGLDFISVGALTHSAPAVDIGLDLVTA